MWNLLVILAVFILKHTAGIQFTCENKNLEPFSYFTYFEGTSTLTATRTLTVRRSRSCSQACVEEGHNCFYYKFFKTLQTHNCVLYVDGPSGSAVTGYHKVNTDRNLREQDDGKHCSLHHHKCVDKTGIISKCECSNGKSGYYCKNVYLRFVGGHKPYFGRLEYFDGTQWGTMCDNGWGNDGGWPAMMCYELGYIRSESSGFAKDSVAGEGTGFIARHNLGGSSTGCSWTDKTRCFIHLCEIVGPPICTHQEDVYAECQGFP